MQLITQETQKKGILPKVVNSNAAGPHISIFIPVKEDSTPQLQQTEFRNLLTQAKDLLRLSMDESQVERFLRPVKKAFLNRNSQEGGRGYAFFKSEDFLFYTSLHIPPPQLVVVASSFHIKPLMHSLSSVSVCYTLTVSPRQKSTRLKTILSLKNNYFFLIILLHECPFPPILIQMII